MAERHRGQHATTERRRDRPSRRPDPAPDHGALRGGAAAAIVRRAGAEREPPDRDPPASPPRAGRASDPPAIEPRRPRRRLSHRPHARGRDHGVARWHPGELGRPGGRSASRVTGAPRPVWSSDGHSDLAASATTATETISGGTIRERDHPRDGSKQTQQAGTGWCAARARSRGSRAAVSANACRRRPGGRRLATDLRTGGGAGMPNTTSSSCAWPQRHGGTTLADLAALARRWPDAGGACDAPSFAPATVQRLSPARRAGDSGTRAGPAS